MTPRECARYHRSFPECGPRCTMTVMRSLLITPLLISFLFVGCDCSDDAVPGDGGEDGSMDATPDGTPPDGTTDSAPGDSAAGDSTAPTDSSRPLPDGGSCTVVGAACAAAGDCCSNSCVDSGGVACGAAGGCSCAPRAACSAGGATCTADADCCNNLCDRPGGAASGTCAALSACATAGEPCSTEGLSGSCCSTVCLDTTGDGPRCQFLGGCRVQDDLCSSDAQCCSGSCAVDGTTADGRDIRRCANVESCLPAGEVCGDGGASSNCCPNGGGDTGCVATSGGFRRCLGGTSDCTIPSAGCTSTADCCVETFSAIMCQPGPAGANICCLSDGEECALGDVCCSGMCTPSASDGVLRCGSTCVPDGATCTTSADCCGCGCVSDGAGGQVCTSDAAECDPCTGPSLGEFCDPTGPACCNGPTVTCIGLEFSTCQLAP